MGNIKGGSPGVKGKIVIDYVKKYPDLPKQTLARLIYNKHKSVFDSQESVRNSVRYYKGAAQNSIGTYNKNKHLHTEHGSEYKKLMEGIKEIEEPTFTIPSAKNLAIINDVHVPFHNADALRDALCIIKDFDQLLINGDFWDAYFISRFEPNPLMRRKLLNTSDELKAVHSVLGFIRDHFEGKIYYKLGNHEERWEKYLRVHAPELLDMAEFKISNLLRFGEYKIESIAGHQKIYYDDFIILHGHEFGDRGDARYVAKNKLIKLQRTEKKQKLKLIFGHHHRTHHYVDKLIEGGEAEAWAVGGLLNLNPAYRYLNEWNHRCLVIDNGDVENIEL